MITLPLRPERVPLVRVLVATSFGNAKSKEGAQLGGRGPWVIQPMLSVERAGLELMDHLTRPALPEIGECTLRMRFGVIDGRIIGLSGQAIDSIREEGGWNSDEARLEVPSLVGKEIRVQLAADDGSEQTWRTEWVGRCVYETDNEWPGASIPAGERIYTCLDPIHRTKYWYMTRHAAYVAGTAYDNAPGHPGYNVGPDGRTIGNREKTGAAWNSSTLAADSDAKFYYHTWQGTTGDDTGTAAAEVWTDLQAAEHALRVMRPEGEPLFSFAGATALLSTGASPWPVSETDSAFDVLMRICARERGRGSVLVDWDDDSEDPSGPLVVKLTVLPQTLDPITYISNPTTGDTATMPGATAQESTVAVDLIGDHRVIPEGFTRGQRGLSNYDAVETVGERIQVLVTASMYDGGVSLERRWSAADEAAFIALDPDERGSERWHPVFQHYGLPRAWQGLAKDHNNGGEVAQHRVDYRCDDLGAIVSFTAQDAQGNTINIPIDTSPLVVGVLRDVPLFEGYVYNGVSPARGDGGTETGEPSRCQPTIWMRMADDRYEMPDEVSLRITQDTIIIKRESDDKEGYRWISDQGEDLGASYDTDQLGITLALELSHRLRFRSLRSSANAQGMGIRNTKRIEVPDAHLWLASPGAIWSVDGESFDSNGSPGQRGACGGVVGDHVNTPGILRDDRTRVAILHALACAWYLQDHHPCSWTIRGCGFLPSFGIVSDGSSKLDPDATIAYPTVGQFVTTITASGQKITVNVPITGKIYNHQAQTTTFSCDWSDLDAR